MSIRLWLSAALTATLLASPFPSGADGVVEIPAILSLTGPAAFIGNSELKTLDVFAAQLNKTGGVRGSQIKFVARDDQSSPPIAVQIANELVSKQFPAFIGPGLTATCAAVAPIIATHGPVGYCLSPAPDPPHGSFAFSGSVSGRALVTALIRYYRARGWNRIATITSSDATGQSLDQDIAAVAALPENKTAGVQLVATEHFNINDIAADAQMAKVKAANPQAVIAWSAGTSTGTLLRSYTNVGLEFPVALGTGNMSFAQMAQYKSFAPKEIYFASVAAVSRSASSKGVKDQQDRYFQALQEAGVPADGVPTYAWDPALIVVSALQRVGVSAKATDVQKYIEDLRGFSGINGTYDFRDGDNRGLGIGDAVVSRWDSATNTFTKVTASK